MRHGHFAILYILLVLLSACQVATPTPTEQAIATDTLVPPTATAQPIATDLPTATPYAPLSLERPYLLFDRHSFDSGKTTIYMMDTKNFGRKIITLPKSGAIGWDLPKFVSPDGQWLAYLSQSDISPEHLNLELLNLQSEESRFIAPLMSEDFPKNQSIVAGEMIELGIQEEARAFIEDGHSLIFGLYSGVSWSPNGKYLAFTAQIDGPSSNIYIYAMSTEEIIQLTDEPFNLQNLFWSPDSEWIIYEGVVMGVVYEGSTLEAINLNTKEIRKFRDIKSAFFWAGVDWISDTEYLTRGSPDGGDPHNLQIANVVTGQYSDLWHETYFSYAVDNENRAFIILGAADEIQVDDENDYLEVDFFQVSYNGERTEIPSDGSWINYFRGGETTRFVGLFRDGVIGFSLDGSSKLITEANKGIYISPDLRWMLVGTQDGFELYDQNDQLIRTFTGIIPPKQHLDNLIWRPDGEGVIMQIFESLYHLEIPNGELFFVEDCSSFGCWQQSSNDTAYTWLP